MMLSEDWSFLSARANSQPLVLLGQRYSGIRVPSGTTSLLHVHFIPFPFTFNLRFSTHRICYSVHDFVFYSSLFSVFGLFSRVYFQFFHLLIHHHRIPPGLLAFSFLYALGGNDVRRLFFRIRTNSQLTKAFLAFGRESLKFAHWIQELEMALVTGTIEDFGRGTSSPRPRARGK